MSQNDFVGCRRPAAIRVMAAMAAMFVAAWVAAVPAGAAAAAEITGYRSTAFGMSETQTRAAIAADFSIAPDDIPRTVHTLEKTTLLTIVVEGLVDLSGSAKITYVLGYRSRQLFKTTIMWRASDGSGVAVGRLLLAARTMINRFALLRFPESRVEPNSALENGVRILFLSRDKHGNLVKIGFYRPNENDSSGSAETSGKERPWLRVTFESGADAPDIFEIEPGQF